MQRATPPPPKGPFRLRAVRAQKWLGLKDRSTRLTAGTAAIWHAQVVSGNSFILCLAGDVPCYLRLRPEPVMLVDHASEATALEIREADDPPEKGQVHLRLVGEENAYMAGGSEGVDVRPSSRGGRRWTFDESATTDTILKDASQSALRTVAASYTCPYTGCGVKDLSEEALCVHCETKHARNNTDEICPVCVANGGPQQPQGRQPWGYSSHLHSAHGPRASHNAIPAGVITYAFALVVCRHPDGRFLLVEECCSQGWWLPGGRVDPGERFEEAAKRETIEEAGMEITLEGVLSFEYAPHRHGGHRNAGELGHYYARQRIVFLAKPTQPQKPPKSSPDYESVGAEWVSWPDLEKEIQSGKRKLRGYEPALWFSHVHKGGLVLPMSLMKADA